MSAPDTLRPPPDCAAYPGCGREVRGHCACDVATVPVPPPSRVGAYVTKRRAIAALWAEADALWDAMSESDHDRVVTSLESLGLVG